MHVRMPGLMLMTVLRLSISSSSSEITKAAENFKDMINTETLTVGKLEQLERAEHSETVKVDGQEVTINLCR
jgi:hypothetical protein